MKKKIGVLQFPGSNCDQDVFKAVRAYQAEFLVSFESIEIQNYKAFIIPGGFSYGDYLRAGALASFSLAMKDIIKAGKKGWPLLGICNGFQILCESGLLEGALLPNQQDQFVDEWSNLKVENESSFWKTKKDISLPIAHGGGCYYAGKDLLKKLQDKRQIWMSYKNNPNGSVENIAGLLNQKGNIAGLMPHPERAVADWMGGTDGLSFFENLG
ncbi:MAG: phosphoribosylformylglycinamidine synthase subunit PurQ [Bdellovibrionales bacterium]|nr:phosphoribosylformylglycinamidine synthase subunit PurQ [Bdellovibrionales bacterium]